MFLDYSNISLRPITGLIVSFSLFMLLPDLCVARDNGITGSFAVKENFDSNTTRSQDNKISAWNTKVSPNLTYDSKGTSDAFLFSYTPSYSKNHESKTEKIDHLLALTENARPSAKWLLAFTEKYIRTDDAAENEGTAFLSSTKLGRNRFWTNVAGINSVLSFGQGSSFTLGYKNTILENENGLLADYIKHETNAALSWQFTPRWQSSLIYNYSEGDFDLIPLLDPLSPEQPQDITTHTGGISLAYIPSLHTNISTNYQYSETEFSSQNIFPDQDPYQVHSGNLRLEQVLSSSTSMAVYGGPSIITRENAKNENNYNYGFELNTKMQKGGFLLSGEGGVDELYFNGTQDDGLTIYWSANTILTYNFTEYFSVDLSGEVRRDKFIDQQPEGRETSYKGNLGFSYNFWRWFTISVSGEYYELDIQTTNSTDQDYDGYRAYFTLAAGRELLRW